MQAAYRKKTPRQMYGTKKKKAEAMLHDDGHRHAGMVHLDMHMHQEYETGRKARSEMKNEKEWAQRAMLAVDKCMHAHRGEQNLHLD